MVNLLNYNGNKFRLTFKFPNANEININGKISIEDGNIFICNDTLRGRPCSDKHGYKFSWWIGDKSKIYLDEMFIFNLEIINK